MPCRKAILSLSTALIGSSLLMGCQEPRSGPSKSSQYRPSQGMIRALEQQPGDIPPVMDTITHRVAGVTYYYDRAANRWYYIDNNGQRVYLPPGQNPPGAGGWSPPPVPPPPARSDIGLHPDASGSVTPAVWFRDHIPMQSGQWNVDDHLEFFMASEPDWVFPFDTNEVLRDAIGASNIHAYELPVQPDGLGNPIMIHLHNIRLGEMITLLTQMGINELQIRWPEGFFQLRLDGTPEDYHRALVYQDGHLIETIDLLH